MVTLYTNEYYQKHESGSVYSSKVILEYIDSLLPITSVVDFGCGIGTWLKTAKEIWKCDILGIDQHDYSAYDMCIPCSQYMQFDLRKELELSRRYDLAISVEVGEHIEPKYQSIYLDNLIKHSDIILFSAALPLQGGTGHINEKPCSHWVDLFKSRGYQTIDCIRPFIWNNPAVEVWYRNNTILFASSNAYDRILSVLHPLPPPIDIIHPDMLRRIIERTRYNG